MIDLLRHIDIYIYIYIYYRKIFIYLRNFLYKIFSYQIYLTIKIKEIFLKNNN